MEKTLKLGQIATIGQFLATTEGLLDGVELNAKMIYHILALKKEILTKADLGREAVVELAKSHNAVPVEETGGMQVPEDKLPEFNIAYSELMNGDETITYEEIIIAADAKCNPKFMEVFFDFITIV